MSDILTAGICSYGHTIHGAADLVGGYCGRCFLASTAEILAIRRRITPAVPPWQDVDLIRAQARRLVRKWSIA